MYPSTLKQLTPFKTSASTEVVLSHTTHLPDSALDAWASQGPTPAGRRARSEIVHVLKSAAELPCSDLDLSHCDQQACLDLRGDLVVDHADVCSRSEPPTIRLILPSGLTEVPAWITKFRVLKELTVPEFVGDANAALMWLKEQCPELTHLRGLTTDSAEFPGMVGTECQLVAHAAPSSTTLRSVYSPYVGKLDEDAERKLRSFMGKVREAAGATPDLTTGSDYHLGGFKVARSSDDGELELLKVETPPYVAIDLHPCIAEGLPKTIEVFETHFKEVRDVVWQAMTKCRYVEYLKAHAASLINDDWDILVDIDPYFNRDPTQIVAHKDTQGENMFVMLLYCNEQPIEGFEYILRLPIPEEHLTFIRERLPPVFVDEVEEVLKEPSDGVVYAPRIEPWGFVAACDELMVHSTPFVHHRGAFVVESVIASMGAAVRRSFGMSAVKDYFDLRNGVQPAPHNVIAQKIYELVTQLEKLPSSDPWIDKDELYKLFNAKLSAEDASMLVTALLEIADKKDPFDGTARINIRNLNHSAVVNVPRGNEALQRQMSGKLDKGEALPHSSKDGRDFLRVWIMARQNKK